MRKVISAILISIFLMNLPGYQASAHVCDDVLGHDPIVIWLEEETIRIIQAGQFKVFLRNEYPGTINKVELIVPPSSFEISVDPALFECVTPGEQVFFLVNLSIPQETRPGLYPLSMKIDAEEFEIAREIKLRIQVEKPTPEPQPKPRATVEVIPEDILIAISAFPDIAEAEPGQALKFKVFVRSGHTGPLHDLVLSLSPCGFEVLDITPRLIEKISPDEMAFFEVSLSVPEEIEQGDYLVVGRLKARELAVERRVTILIRVKAVSEWLPYIYILAVLSLVSLLILRWQKAVRQRSRQLRGR